ncbi:flagellar biosynthetic protein FliR [Paracoccus sp. SCSIO 75233]|uniref:flagellar biosynthetic protein FliR n=1 Tax=Paracoccus sp. SCSIO 75233 TaxID=3017782 RepID=UPI0022EFFE54|nr:flagellar biosynthetic protein FliR [Paracoccus sp. SCSIO 75233]WBU53137.1 flagellar biosynthetic protein FliR [Paracoccus sp. SCSIO 75233]
MPSFSALPDELAAQILPLILAYLRVQAAVLIFPVFSERILPMRVRVSVAMMLTPIAASLSDMSPRSDIDLPSLMLLSLREFLVGALIVIPARIAALSLHMASSAIAANVSLSQMLGGSADAPPHPVGNLLHLAGLAVLMAAGLPLLLMDVIADSYAVFPSGTYQFGQVRAIAIVGLIARSFMLAMALASPFILGGLLFQLLSGVVNRVMPQLPVIFVAAPALVMLALVGLSVLSPAILAGWMDAVFDSGWP